MAFTPILPLLSMRSLSPPAVSNVIVSVPNSIKVSVSPRCFILLGTDKSVPSKVKFVSPFIALALVAVIIRLSAPSVIGKPPTNDVAVS